MLVQRIYAHCFHTLHVSHLFEIILRNCLFSVYRNQCHRSPWFDQILFFFSELNRPSLELTIVIRILCHLESRTPNVCVHQIDQLDTVKTKRSPISKHAHFTWLASESRFRIILTFISTNVIRTKRKQKIIVIVRKYSRNKVYTSLYSSSAHDT